MPKISVIIPVYNTEKYLRKCLDSVVNQTYQDLEIIIVNDGSTDNSEMIINEYKGKYPEKIKYFKKENTGIADTRNFAIELVMGEYFLFVDSDDYLEKNLCEILIKYVNKDKTDIIKYKMKIIKNDKSINIDGPIFEFKNGQDAFNTLCFSDKIIDTPCVYLFNTKFYKENNFQFTTNTYHEDFGLIPLIIVKAKKFISIDFYGYNYNQIENSITRNDDYEKTVKRANDLLVHYDNMLQFININNLKINTIRNVKEYYSNAILNYINKLKREDKNRYIKVINEKKLIENIQINNIKKYIKRFYFLLISKVMI